MKNLTFILIAIACMQCKTYNNLVTLHETYTIPLSSARGQSSVTIYTDSLFIPVYDAWIIPTTEKKRLQGFVFETGDSTILFCSTSTGSLSNAKEMLEIPVKNIDKILIRKKGKVGRGAMVGALGGAACGGIIGAASFNKDNSYIFSAGTNTVFLAFALMPVGSVVGALVGTRRTTISIHGSQETYLYSRLQIQQRSLTRE